MLQPTITLADTPLGRHYHACAHPVVILGRSIQENPFYLPAEQCLREASRAGRS